MVLDLAAILSMCDDYFTPGENTFSNFVLWSSDHNGDFLRTCHRMKSKRLPDQIRLIKADVDRVIIAFDRPFDKNLLAFDCIGTPYPEPEIMLQVIFTWEESVLDEMEWSEQLGYEYPYVLDIKTGQIAYAGK